MPVILSSIRFKSCAEQWSSYCEGRGEAKRAEKGSKLSNDTNRAAGGGGNVVNFTYDGLGRCVRRVVYPPGGGSRTLLFTYDGWKPVMEWDEAGNCQAWNIYGSGPDEILWRCQSGVGNLRYHHDVHGNVAFLLDSNGNRLEKYTYDAFGAPTAVSWNPAANTWDEANRRTWSAYGNRFLFQGREWIAELGIYDYRHRMYNPGLGRFLQTDPTGFDAGDMNLFRYCDDDPVDGTDATGLLASPTDILKPNLIITGQGDWMRVGSPFTNGEMLSKVRNYLGELNSIVDRYVNRANRESQNVEWSADYSNWLKSSKDFKNPRDVATTELSTKSDAVMNADGTVASFNVNLHIDIKWNADQSRYFGSALRTDTFGLGKTGEIEHARDALKALTSSYGGGSPARAIADQQAASMLGQNISQREASSRMDAALVEWRTKTTDQSRLDHDGNGEHTY